jgi:hypothetical protein
VTATDPLPAEVEALVLATLSKRVAARIDGVKATFSGQYADGQRETFRSPLDDAKLGMILRTDPDPTWKIVDPTALDAELRTYVVDAALAQSRDTGTPAAAGIARVKPGGVLTVKPDKGAAAAVERMVAAGVITWDGQPVLTTPTTQPGEAA